LSELSAPVPQLDIDSNSEKSSHRDPEASTDKPGGTAQPAAAAGTLSATDSPESQSEEQIAEMVGAFLARVNLAGNGTGSAATE
jgi:hypothetical protein